MSLVMVGNLSGMYSKNTTSKHPFFLPADFTETKKIKTLSAT
jgi:hypothetical protein